MIHYSYAFPVCKNARAHACVYDCQHTNLLLRDFYQWKYTGEANKKLREDWSAHLPCMDLEHCSLQTPVQSKAAICSADSGWSDLIDLLAVVD